MSKYLTLTACCLIHLVIGSVYADSVLYVAITQSTGWEQSWLVGGFAATIVALGCAAASYRKFSQGSTTRMLLTEAAALYTITMGLMWAMVLHEHVLGIWGYLLLCVFRGGCIGVMYAVTVSCATSLIPSHRGLCSGLVVMSFGLGSLVATRAYSHLLQFSLGDMMYLQVIYWVVLVVALVMFQKGETITYTPVATVIADPMWQRLSAVFFLNICVGITLLSNLVSMTTEQGLTYTEAIWLVGAAGVANGLGRIIYSTLSDTLGRLEVLRVALVIQTLCLVMLPWCWEVAVVGIISVYGGGFALMPSICAQYLQDGVAGYSALLGWWGIAGLVGPLVYLLVPSIWLLAATSAVALVLTNNLLKMT